MTFHFVNLTWVFFRAKDLDDAWKVIRGLYGFEGFVVPGFMRRAWGDVSAFGFEYGSWPLPIPFSIWTVAWFAGAFVLVLGFQNSTSNLTRWRPSLVKYIWIGVAFVLFDLFYTENSEFLYFNF